MPTTSNFGWTTPADTDLVKDGAAAIRTLGNGVDASLVDLKGGTTGQVLSKATNTDLDYTWITPNVGDITEVQAGTGISVASGTGPIPVVTNTVATAIDAKGDLIVGTGADTFARLAVGTNDYVLTAASGETTGLKWAAAASPSYTWTAYTPTIVSGTGTLTTASASGRYLKIDKFIFVTISATVTTNGTGASNILISAPFSAVNLGSTALFRENAVTGNIGQVYISGSDFTLTTSTNTYPAANGYQFVFGIGYEVA